MLRPLRGHRVRQRELRQLRQRVCVRIDVYRRAVRCECERVLGRDRLRDVLGTLRTARLRVVRRSMSPRHGERLLGSNVQRRLMGVGSFGVHDHTTATAATAAVGSVRVGIGLRRLCSAVRLRMVR